MGCTGFLNTMMFLFNGIIFLAGAAILGVAIWVKVDSGSIFGLIEKLENAPEEVTQLLNVAYLLIALGSVLLIIGFLGCCGAMRQSKCMLLTFFIIILLVFIAEVAGALVILVFRPLVDELIAKIGIAAVSTIKMNYGKNPDITGLWNTTMSVLKCCGFHNSSDFVGSPFYEENNHQYPAQCCGGNSTICHPMVVEVTIAGCFPKISQLFADNTVVVVSVALAIAALEICAMTVSMKLFCSLKSRSAFLH
ncbi:tetraspanin 35 isoform X1 [Takifugu rubripes]|nr:tetraspanin-1-like isoform X1 [Takifugu rubripes]